MYQEAHLRFSKEELVRHVKAFMILCNLNNKAWCICLAFFSSAVNLSSIYNARTCPLHLLVQFLNTLKPCLSPFVEGDTSLYAVPHYIAQHILQYWLTKIMQMQEIFVKKKYSYYPIKHLKHRFVLSGLIIAIFTQIID